MRLFPCTLERTIVILDHLRYVRERPYRRARNAEFHRVAEKVGLSQLTVVHEHNGSCCQIEMWPTTFARLIESLNDDGLKTVGMVKDEKGLGLVLRGE